ncbi:carbamoyl-phosphate synthase large subunit [Clostridium tetanomorphum]|uniref:carbamoyl-phosphate synthase (glutamine-hydrolyzing) large subunit n=1 Tax=Clostridium tetanomorphum TaxID=1553 RepID=UPI0004503C14|nr:carbamoyl-phosphate synthase (glutamine-hydrolyzing) large subunit [Clostridium tetanomorphum]KAJ52815.1 carbamoyl phosphate synthase large subunit [Clostridium tetanomorphum DSM 665]MBP1865400.1 carbamoyl-phosphate synthase large subunit [Clostridium tetanomorphum]NRS84833.1 carbamoyl-phosphate synthase large subunit [Clostridium tetanomorphum]SQB91660.1 carbamoyl-phosphate synthase large subunit [Clostridium tetanomorphum]
MPLNKDINKVLIIGSGPIIIGQAAEFDYSGTQACEAIKEEGIETILVNSNPATIMTDEHIADKTYIEPLTVDCLENILKKERPYGILAGFGGQTALNIAMELKSLGILDKYGVKLLGIKEEAIKKAEDREEFKNLMKEIGEPIPVSTIANNLEQCKRFVEKEGFPVIIRPAFTLGGTGGGIVSNYDELTKGCKKGLEESPIGQILLEQSVGGWKEIEYEVIRDGKDNSMVVCNMENIDPVSIHTGDSIVVAPSQTLSNEEYQMLRNASLKIIKSLKIEGGCNVQFALHPKENRYIVIEVNPRVSRSSSLASKAAGYPIAKIAAKIALGYSLNELKNYVTGNSSAFFEPALDYCVVKIPKWPFDKFRSANRTLGTQMKATGEVMAIDRCFESALLKGVISLEGEIIGLSLPSLSIISEEEIIDKIKLSDDERLFAIAEGIRKGLKIEEIHEITKIDKWFLNKIENIINMEKQLINNVPNINLIHKAETMGFTDEYICKLIGIDRENLEKIKSVNNIKPVYKMVDTCSGEFLSNTPYYYSCYDNESDNIITKNKKILVIGSGPIRIGQGIEFDYCCVHGVWAIKREGYEAIIINNNPETVSTDFDVADKLYFDPLYIDDVMNVIREENVEGVIVQFGGQTAINLCKKLKSKGINILGTCFDSIDLAEDRDKFRSFLNKLEINTPIGAAVTNLDEVDNLIQSIGFPLIVRPSYVIGGRAMQVFYHKENLYKYLKEEVNLSKEHPVLIDKYIKAIEIEVDGICDGENVLIPGIMEHVEKTGVHSGDSISIYPPISLDNNVLEKIEYYTWRISKALDIKGLINIQYAYDGKEIYVIEVNPRASRTVPILSKITGIPMVDLAVEIMLGKTLKELNYPIGIYRNEKFYAVKMPIFSTKKLAGVDIALGPEMKSTGEVLGIDFDLNVAIYKAFKASGTDIISCGNMYVSLNNKDKEEGVNIIKEYEKLGFNIFASYKTYEYLNYNKIKCKLIDIQEAINDMKNKAFNLIINTASVGNNKNTKGFKLRRKAIENNISIFTSLDTAKAYIRAIQVKREEKSINCSTLMEYRK